MSNTDGILRYILALAGLSIIAVVVMLLLGYRSEVGIPLISFLTFLAIGIRGIESMRGFAFTVWVFARVSMAMFYPSYITDVKRIIYKSWGVS